MPHNDMDILVWLIGIDNFSHVGSLRRAVTLDESEREIIKALTSSPYGRCVFKCDNDVVDHQVVNLEFEDDITATFTMIAFTYETTRKIRIFGTKGELTGDMTKNHLSMPRSP